MVLTLYKMDASPPVRAVYMVANILKIPDLECIELNVLNKEHMKGSFLEINPQHTIPTLIDDGFVIWDSHAIALYLIRKYAEDDTLYPSDPKIRAIVDQRLHFDTGVLFASIRYAVKPVLHSGAKTLTPEAYEEIQAGYDFAEKFLKTPWMAGEDLTLADICCVATISSMNVLLPIDPEKYPRVTSWIERCSALDFYKEANEPGLKEFQAIMATLFK